MASFSSGFSARIMPPKRRAASAAKAGGKKVKQEPETPAPKDAFTSAKEALLAAGSQVKCNRKVDEHCSVSGEVSQIIYTSNLTQNAKCKLLLIKNIYHFHQIHDDYDCMLNQTNIGHNNNKFYVNQLINGTKQYYTWNRWGRVVSLSCKTFQLNYLFWLYSVLLIYYILNISNNCTFTLGFLYFSFLHFVI